MKRHNIAHPLFAWTALTMKTCEMLFASAQVIGHRSTRIVAAGPNPNARDRSEFTLMKQEKIDAVAASGQAMAIRMMAINQQIGMMVLKQWISGAGRAVSLALAPTLALTGKRQAELLRSAMANWAATTSKLSGSTAQLAHQGLVPFHSRATGNARRLLRR